MVKHTFHFLFLLFSTFTFAQGESILKYLENDFYQTQFTGLYLYDPVEKKELFNYNGNKYFTPASNTKIFTLYAAMKTISDSIPAFKYVLNGDDLHIEGTGDPTFLHPKFKNPQVISFLKNNGKKIILHWNNLQQEAYAPGWTWDDFRKDYSPERSQFPIHENSVNITKYGNTLNAFPTYFKEFVRIKDTSEPRELYENIFYLKSRATHTKVPFIIKEDVIKNILNEVTGKPIEISNTPISISFKLFYSNPSDRIYKEMMEQSDNFLAEHLLLVTSSSLNLRFNTEKTIDVITQKYLKDLKQKPIWIDGSGLSRYNLFTPQNLVQVLEKLYIDFPEERLFSIFPVGGKTGTIKNRYRDTTIPYLYAKTGSLSNTITLSGYIKSKGGKTLIFSLMNNNSTKDASLIRNENEKLIKLIRDLY